MIGNDNLSNKSDIFGNNNNGSKNDDENLEKVLLPIFEERAASISTATATASKINKTISSFSANCARLFLELLLQKFQSNCYVFCDMRNILNAAVNDKKVHNELANMYENHLIDNMENDFHARCVAINVNSTRVYTKDLALFSKLLYIIKCINTKVPDLKDGYLCSDLSVQPETIRVLWLDMVQSVYEEMFMNNHSNNPFLFSDNLSSKRNMEITRSLCHLIAKLFVEHLFFNKSYLVYYSECKSKFEETLNLPTRESIFDQLYAILKKKVKNAAQHQRRKAEMMNKDSEPKGKRQKHEVDQDSGGGDRAVEGVIISPSTGHIVNKKNLPNLLLKLPANPAEYITRKAILPNMTLKLPANPAECIITSNKSSLPDLMNQIINEKRLELEEREAPKTNKPSPQSDTHIAYNALSVSMSTQIPPRPLPSIMLPADDEPPNTNNKPLPSPQSDTHIAYNALSVSMSTQIQPPLPSIMLPAVDEPIEINQSSKIYNQQKKLLPATANIYGSSEEAIIADFHIGCNALTQDYATVITANEHKNKRKNNISNKTTRKYQQATTTDHNITEPVASVSHYGRKRKPNKVHDVKELGDA